jgi:integrase
MYPGITRFLKNEKTLAAIRDNALLQIGFFGAFRRGELINIRVEHIKVSEEGMTILIPKSKTDQGGAGQYCAIPYGNENLCPGVRLTNGFNKVELIVVLFLDILIVGK